jgi:hypothetical protein
LTYYNERKTYYISKGAVLNDMNSSIGKDWKEMPNEKKAV